VTFDNARRIMSGAGTIGQHCSDPVEIIDLHADYRIDN